MGARGRKSSDAVNLLYEPVSAAQRPKPLSDLTEEEGEEWVAVVNSMPAHHFIRANYPILAQYCRHVCFARAIAEMIEQDRALLVVAMKDKAYKLAGDLKKSIMALMKQHNAESAQINALARSMRLTQRSVKAESMTHPKTAEVMPWEKRSRTS